MTYDDPRDEEAPLDPAAERLRRKLLRLLMVSGGFMILGLIAVFAAIVYRLGGWGDPGEAAETALQASAPAAATLALPAGARLRAADLDGGRALLTLETPRGATLLLVSLPSGQILGRYDLQPE